MELVYVDIDLINPGEMRAKKSGLLYVSSPPALRHWPRNNRFD